MGDGEVRVERDLSVQNRSFEEGERFIFKPQNLQSKTIQFKAVERALSVSSAVVRRGV